MLQLAFTNLLLVKFAVVLKKNSYRGYEKTPLFSSGISV